ncbi:MAG: adenosylmethionine--8-amino-7-oxononanoate transaminase [Parvibaculales bacterium]
MTVSPENPALNRHPDWQLDGADHLWPPYTQMQTTPLGLPVASAEGVRIKLTDGRELVDGVSSWWSTCHGYRHPHIEAAVMDQLQKLPHVMLGGFQHEPASRLAKKLADLCPGHLNHVFFSDSGSVAVEVGMKMAVQYWMNKGEKGRYRFLSFTGGYHGDTLATMSVCDPEEGMHSLFKDALAKQVLVDVPHTQDEQEAFSRILAAHCHELAAVVIEPLVQGAGGMKFHDEDTLSFIHAQCKAHNVLLLTDEIMTGLGRLGHMFACERAGIVPDILTLSKSLTGGTMALAATIASTDVFEAFLSDDDSKALMHGPTYMGNPLACRAALASLELFEQEPRLEQVKQIEVQLRDELAPAADFIGVRDVRVRGAIGVIEFDRLKDLNHIKQRFVEEGVWVRPFRNILYTMPPYIIQPEELSMITSAMVKITKEISPGGNLPKFLNK